jgi:hypothetical protein
MTTSKKQLTAARARTRALEDWVAAARADDHSMLTAAPGAD